MKQLSDEQLSAFDTEYVSGRRWVPIKQCIDRDFPDGDFAFLDLGGGNGLFADRVLAHYPRVTGVVLDDSHVLLGKNQPNDRKRTTLASVENLADLGGKYDLIFFNWLLHHLVGRSYRQSRENVDRALRDAALLLSNRGRVSVYENMYNGLVLNGAPGRIVYHLTSARAIARLTRRGGANTAGVGVCFLSHKQWCATIRRAGLQILDYTDHEHQGIPWAWTALLHVGSIRYGHFWLAR